MSESGDKFDLAKRLRELADEQGLSFKYLSVKSGVPLKTLYGWSAGNRPRNLQDLNKVAECLGVSIAELSFSSSAPKTHNGEAPEASRWIAQWREGAGLTPSEAAKAAGLRVDELLAYEGTRDVPVSLLVRLMKLYRQDVRHLFEKIESLYQRIEM